MHSDDNNNNNIIIGSNEHGCGWYTVYWLTTLPLYYDNNMIHIISYVDKKKPSKHIVVNGIELQG